MSPEQIDAAVQQLPQSTGDKQKDNLLARAFVRQRAMSLLQLHDQLNTQYPAPSFVNNGQQQMPVASGNPALTGTPAGTPQGAPVQNLVPPTAPTMRGGQPGYVGVRPDQPPGTAIASGPALGQAEGVSGQVAPNVEHFKQVTADASAAPTRIGILQEIKSLAPQASTGSADWKKLVISKLAGYAGWAGDATQTANDVMAKESAMLAAKSGNTDLARVLGEMATPNHQMTEKAIKKAADQLIGQENAKVAAQQYFAGTAPDSPVYTEKLKAWNSVADPRVFEFAAKGPTERAEMKAELVKSGQWATFRNKMVQLHMMGVQPPGE